MQNPLSVGCSSSNTQVWSFQSSLILALFCLSQLSPFLPSKQLQSSTVHPYDLYAPVAPLSCPSPLQSQSRRPSPYAAVLDSAFAAFPRSPATVLSASGGNAAAALHPLQPVIATGAPATPAVRVALVVHVAGNAAGVDLRAACDAEFVAELDVCSRRFHCSLHWCQNLALAHRSFVEQLTFHSHPHVFTANATASHESVPSTLKRPAHSTELPWRSLAPLLAPEFSSNLLVPRVAESADSRHYPVPSACFDSGEYSSLEKLSTFVTPSSSSSYSPSSARGSGASSRQFLSRRAFRLLRTARLSAAVAGGFHRSLHASSSFPILPSPVPLKSLTTSPLQLQTFLIDSKSSLRFSELPARDDVAPARVAVSFSLRNVPTPAPQSQASSATVRATALAHAASEKVSLWQLLSSAVTAVYVGIPSLVYVAAEHHRPRPHRPPLPHEGSHRHEAMSSFEDASTHTADAGEEESVAAPVAKGDSSTVMRTPPTIRPRRRVTGRRSSSDWQHLFGDLRLVDMALPATMHSALTDVNSVKYFELAVGQKAPVSRQLLDGIRMFDVRAWRNGQDGQWYSEVPWRLEDDLRLLREYAPNPNDPTMNGFVSSMLRGLSLRPGGKERGRKGQQDGGERRGGEGRKAPSKVSSLIDLHSWTSLKEGLFKPIQEFLRTHISEVAVVVISSFNGNRRTPMNAVPHAASLASSLRRIAARQQQGQQEGTAAGSSSARLEGHPFYQDFLSGGAVNSTGTPSPNDRGTRQQQVRNMGGASMAGSPAAGASNGPVFAPGSLYTSPAYLDSVSASPAAYEVLDPLDTSCSFYMSSAVRKPLTYADVASFMELVDKHWGQLLPRHSHVFFGPAADSGPSPPPTMGQAPSAPSPSLASSTVPGALGVPTSAAAAPGQATLAANGGRTPSPYISGGPPPPIAAALQRSSSSPPSLRSLGAVWEAPIASGQQLAPTLLAPVALPNAGVRRLGEEGAVRPPTAAEMKAMEDLKRRGKTRKATDGGATAAVTAAKTGGAPARAGAAVNLRAAAMRPPPSNAANVPPNPTTDPTAAGGRPGATTPALMGGLEAQSQVPSPTSEKGVPIGGRAGPADTAGTVLDGGGDAAAGSRGVGADYNNVAAAGSNGQIDSYPMYESLHRPEAFAEWLRAQGDLLVAKATIKDLLDAKIRLLLFVEDPLIAWYITSFSREHVIVFVAADHTYDVLYKSEALFGPCALPNRASAAPNSMLLNVSREATWAGCRERCEMTPPLPTRPEEGRLLAKLRAARGRLGGLARDAIARSCSYWTYEPPVVLDSVPPVLSKGGNTHPMVSSSALGLLPFAWLSGSKGGSGAAAKEAVPPPESTTSAAMAASMAGSTELKGECRIYAGPLTLAETLPSHGSIIQPRSCGLRTLYELPTQWASAAVFADLTDAVCPIFEVAPKRPGPEDLAAEGNVNAAAYGRSAPSSGKDDKKQKGPRSYQFFPDLCMLDATPRSLRDALRVEDEEDSIHAKEAMRTNQRRLKGAGLERKLLRVYFSPPSPVPFVDGTRGGRREVGPVDAVTLMNELTATWALWQLERQQLVASLTVVEPVDGEGGMEQAYAYEAAATMPGADSRNRAGDNASNNMSSRGGGAVEGSDADAGYLGGRGSNAFAGRERARPTRPVNALMVMRYDQTRSLIKNFSHLNYFEIIMNLNPQPKETRTIVFQGGEGAELSADRYVKVTAILNSLGVEDETSEAHELETEDFEVDDTTEEEKRAQTLMMWLAICAAVICFLIVAIGSTMRSAIFSKRAPRGGWTAAESPNRASVATDH